MIINPKLGGPSIKGCCCPVIASLINRLFSSIHRFLHEHQGERIRKAFFISSKSLKSSPYGTIPGFITFHLPIFAGILASPGSGTTSLIVHILSSVHGNRCLFSLDHSPVMNRTDDAYLGCHRKSTTYSVLRPSQMQASRRAQARETNPPCKPSPRAATPNVRSGMQLADSTAVNFPPRLATQILSHGSECFRIHAL